MGSHFLLQGIFLTQGSNPALVPHLLHCRQVLYHLSHQGSFPFIVYLDHLLILIWLLCAIYYFSVYSLCLFFFCFLFPCFLCFLFPSFSLVMSDSLRPHRLYSPWNSTGQNTGVGSLFLLQGIFPTQGSNPSLLHCRQILYQVSHRGSPFLPYLSIFLLFHFDLPIIFLSISHHIALLVIALHVTVYSVYVI